MALAQRLGADAIVEGHTGDVRVAASAFAPHGLDTALVTAGGDAAEQALGAFEVHVDRTFAVSRAVEAHHALNTHNVARWRA